MLKFYQKLLYNNTRDLLFHSTPSYIYSIYENDQIYVPRFKLNNTEIFDDFPTNTPMKYSSELLLKAIQWGMIIQIDYKGAEDDKMEGHVRTIYPMAYGRSKDGKPLLRGWHLNGWSVSNSNNITKEWRLFRCDRILNMSFTGSFFRLAPDGYVMRDKSMAKIFGMADFNEIRNLQQTLLQKDQIDIDNKVISKLNRVNAKDMNYLFKIYDPWKDNVISKKDADNIRISFAKPVTGSGAYIGIIGRHIQINDIFKLYTDNNLVGNYKSIKNVMANELQTIKNIEQHVEFKLYLFESGN